MSKKLLIILLVFSTLLSANTHYLKEFGSLKMEYLDSVLTGNSEKKVETLKRLIKVGKKANRNVDSYERELRKLDSSYNYNSLEVVSIRTSKDRLYVKFNRNITKKDIVFYEKNRNRVYKDIFLIKAKYNKKIKKLKLKNFFNIKTTIRSDDIKIVFEHNRAIKSVYNITNNQLSIKIYTKQEPTILSDSNTTKVYKGQKVVVIDPGHGGKDSGTIASKGKYEKEIVLKVSKYLTTFLKNRGYKVYNTRTKDKFVKLINRTNLANRKKADIFISIHANAIESRNLEGLETYFLSSSNRTTKRAKRVAEKENARIIKKIDYKAQLSLITILNQARITASNKLAVDVHRNMLQSLRKEFKSVKDNGVREGPFWVLIGAQMPAVLIETGYVTNSKEKKRLFNPRYQKLLAQGIANGIDEYFIKNED